MRDTAASATHVCAVCRDGSGNERPLGICPPNDGWKEGMRGERGGKMEGATCLRGGRKGRRKGEKEEEKRMGMDDRLI